MDREKRIQFIKDHGYKNVSVFADAVNEHPSNVHKILKGQQIPKIQKLFVYAEGEHKQQAQQPKELK